jgi:hypothetical protein
MELPPRVIRQLVTQQVRLEPVLNLLSALICLVLFCVYTRAAFRILTTVSSWAMSHLK